jgi:CRISPR-associated endonuclease/helicase Cas3
MKKAIDTNVYPLSYICPMESTQSNSSLSRLLCCWGKTGNEEQDFHPALFHMLDVGHVAQQLLTAPASPRWQHVLGRGLNADPEALVNWLPWLIALHDIGKISVPFQAQNQAQKLRLEAAGFTFGRWKPKDKLDHSLMGQIFLKRLLKDRYASLPLPPRLVNVWLEMIGGHHGMFAAESLGETSRTLSFIQEPEAWEQLRTQAIQILQRYFLRQLPLPMAEPSHVSAAIMALTGFTILCDWLGSDSRYFAPHSHIDLAHYIPLSRQSAQRAVAEAGFFQPSYSETSTVFAELFPQCVPVRPLQQAIDAIPADVLSQPCLAIIEAPTGEGKTEAALALAHRLAQSSGSDEFYYALPTTATSNQMFIRIQEYLRDRLGLATRAKLVHGQAFLVEDDLQIEPLANGDETPASLTWFTPKKRALLAPFGIGTVDQAELAALNVRHNALRLIGLAGKVVILDEVHAYDTYMTTIIEQMLRWLSALGSSVILLSATLPLSRRNALARAYGLGLNDELNQRATYPSLWIGSRAGTYHVTPPTYQSQRPFQFSTLHIPHDEATLKAQWLLEAVAAGGCACWITNTVDRAQKLTQAVAKLDANIDCLLLHSRFPLEDRQSLEQQLREKYGPKGDRPQRSLVIGTQVLEQSLDLDFDVMVSDLAPIDLLLQRMGRVHRHQNERPPAHQLPRFWVNCELDPEQPHLVQMGEDSFYAAYLLQKTRQAIANLATISLPADYRPLVEAVYSTDPPEPTDPLYTAWDKLNRQEIKALGEATLRLLPDPDPARPFCHHHRPTFVEGEDSAAWIVAQTRLGPETITVIPLERKGDMARLIPTDEMVDLTAAPDRATQLRLLRRSFSLSQRQIVQYFKRLGKPVEPLFSQSALLKSVRPLWLNNSPLTIENTTLSYSLNAKLGLVIEKEILNGVAQL